MTREAKIALHILAIVLSVAGGVLIGFENWKIMIGVFLFIWANNISNAATKEEKGNTQKGGYTFPNQKAADWFQGQLRKNANTEPEKE